MTTDPSSVAGRQTTNTAGLPTSDTVPADKRELIERIAVAVESSQGGFRGNNQSVLRDTLRGVLSLHSFEGLAAIDSAMLGSHALSSGVAKQIMSNAPAETVYDTLRVYPLLGVENYLKAESLLKSVRHYWQFPELENFFEAPAESQSYGIALMKVTHAITEERGLGSLPAPRYEDDTTLRFLYSTGDIPTYRLHDKDLTQVILGNSDRADEIVSVIRAHCTTDARVIGAILDGVAPSLADGAL